MAERTGPEAAAIAGMDLIEAAQRYVAAKGWGEAFGVECVRIICAPQGTPRAPFVEVELTGGEASS